MPDGFHHVHLEIRSTTDSVDLVQVVAEHIARRLGIGEDSLHWTVMAVREAVINAITHGNRGDVQKRVFIDFSASPEDHPADLVVRVRDEGLGFDPAKLKDPLTQENILKANGRGIFLIRQFMDDVSIQPAREGGMEVRMLKHLR
jgi:serine/threonine-protein kinase RsbW